jgi:valyl-tRNA synthetase
MSGFEYKHEKPFSNVYFTGIVRDELGRKMSKSLGNSPDLLALIDKYGADAVRFGIIISSPAGNDLLFDVKEESTLKQGSFFINKIWNAAKLVKGWESRLQVAGYKLQATGNQKPETGNFSVVWFENRLNEVKLEIEKLYEQFKLSEALKTIYSLIWDDFCSWYLEWIKPGFEQPIDAEVYNKTILFFEALLQFLHPFMPFVTEEIYHLLRANEDDICVKQMNNEELIINSEALIEGASLKNIITAIRDARNKNNIKPKESISLFVQSENNNYKNFESILLKQVNAESINAVSENVAGTIVVAVEKNKFFIKSNAQADASAIKFDLEKDLQYQRNFLQSVQKKLSNERFVQNAKPEVVELEKKKQADAEARIKTLEESLQNLV